jgi:hypothetical protein
MLARESTPVTRSRAHFLVRRPPSVDILDDVVFIDTGDDSGRRAAGREGLGIETEYPL